MRGRKKEEEEKEEQQQHQQEKERGCTRREGEEGEEVLTEHKWFSSCSTNGSHHVARAPLPPPRRAI